MVTALAVYTLLVIVRVPQVLLDLTLPRATCARQATAARALRVQVVAVASHASLIVVEILASALPRIIIFGHLESDLGVNSNPNSGVEYGP